MMRKYRVPVGMTEEEMERATEFFNKNEKNKVKWYELWKKKPKLSTMYSDNNHS